MSVPYEGDSNIVGTPGLTGTNSGFPGFGTGVFGKCTGTGGLGVSGECVGPSALSLPPGAGLPGGFRDFFGAGVLGSTNANAGTGVGGLSDSGPGVYGASTSSSGVYGTSTSGNGVVGMSTGADAIYGETSAEGHAGVTGLNTSSPSTGTGVFGTCTGTAGFGVTGECVGPSELLSLPRGAAPPGGNPEFLGAGVLGSTNANAATGVGGLSDTGLGLYGASTSSSGVYGTSTDFDAIVGETNSDAHAGVTGRNLTTGAAGGVGVYGTGGQYAGKFDGALLVNGAATTSALTVNGSDVAIQATGGQVAMLAAGNETGIVAYSTDRGGVGVEGTGDACGVIAGSGSGIGIMATSDAATNPIAGQFVGAVQVYGTLTKSAGGFRIDHPLNPEDQYLQHSFVESPDMMNVYCGTAVLDDQGEAEVKLPDWFEALNREFRYQLTCVGKFVPVFISKEIAHNKFGIAGGAAGIKVCWQVTGVRQDAYAEQYRLAVEIDKDTEVDPIRAMHSVRRLASDRRRC